MSVPKQVRDDYKKGQRDAAKSVPEQAVNDITVNHPDTKPYYDVREGKPLDADKKDEEKKSSDEKAEEA